MTRIYLVRHAESEGNLYRRMHGHYNSGVTELGRAQLEALRQRFADIPIDAVYSSDLYRTMLTASVICLPKQLPLYTDPRLREVFVGPWEDRPFGEVYQTHPEQMYHFMFEPDLWRLEGADTFRGLAQRGISALTDIAKANPKKTVAVCAHSYIINAILCGLFYGYDSYGMIGRSENTAVSLLRWDGTGFHLEFKHDASHLNGTDLRRTRWRPASGTGEFYFRPLTDIDLYIKFRKDAWQVVYGNTADFNGPGFWMDAQRTIGPDPNAMVAAYLGSTPAGMIQLSPARDAKRGVGYIPFLYLREPYRNKGLGIQLIGHAVSFYRALGRTRLQLSVAHTNAHGLAFYKKFGFYPAGKHHGLYGNLILMEKDIRIPALPKELSVYPAFENG